MLCGRVLVLDDDVDVVDALKEVLKTYGVPEVRGALSLADGEATIVGGFWPCVVVLDLVLVRERGEEFLHWLQTAPVNKGVRVVALSGHEPSLKGLAGAVASLLKPVEPENLLAAVADAWASLDGGTALVAPTT